MGGTTSFPPGHHPSPSTSTTTTTTTTTGRRPATTGSTQPAASPGGGHLAPEAIQRLDDGHQPVHHVVYSPDTVASELLTADLASTRWFDLLATDAAQADAGFTLAPSRPQTRPPSPSVDYHHVTPQPGLEPGAAGPSAHNTGQGPSSSNSSSVVQIAAPDFPDASLERREWQLDEDICLRDQEVTLFRTFTERAALWLDLFDPCRHFSTYATRFAVSKRQISGDPSLFHTYDF